MPVIRPAPDVLWLEMLQTLRFYREGKPVSQREIFRKHDG